MASGSGEDPWEEEGPPVETITDVERLKQAWRNEKFAPEILQFQADLVQRAREQIQLQEENVEEMLGSGTEDITMSLHQMDLDRTLFLLRSYLRTRLQKIEKYMMHISKTEHLWSRLSEQEQKFARRCTDIMEKHLDQSVLARLPYGYRSILKQSISSEEDDMVPEPNLDTFVFCRSKGSIEPLQLDETSDKIIFAADDLYTLRYKSIKALIERSRIGLV